MPPENRLALASVTTKLLTPVRVMAKAVQPAKQAAEGECQRNRHRDRQAEHLHQIARRHHRADADRADRKVHAAGSQHHHLCEADDDVDCHRAAKRIEIETREKARRETGKDHPHDDQDDEGDRTCVEPRMRRFAAKLGAVREGGVSCSMDMSLLAAAWAPCMTEFAGRIGGRRPWLPIRREDYLQER